MKNKGFTLIELLAVIVILAIVALILVPIVLGMINNSSEQAKNRSIELYKKAIENAIVSQSMLNPLQSMYGEYRSSKDGNNYIIVNKTNANNTIKIDYDGNEVVCNTIILHENGSLEVLDCTVQ